MQKGKVYARVEHLKLKDPNFLGQPNNVDEEVRQNNDVAF